MIENIKLDPETKRFTNVEPILPNNINDDIGKPKYLRALSLYEQGLSYTEIALILRVKRVNGYLYKARHLEKKLEEHRQHCQRHYSKYKEEVSIKKKDYWKRNQERLHRERLTTVIDGKRVTFYHLNKRERPEICELCQNVRLRLYYHHWDGTNLNMGMWLCGHCHRFVSRIERGDIEKYKIIKAKIEQELKRGGQVVKSAPS